MEMYLFDGYVKEALTKRTADYVAVSHAGHGANSYAINYHLVDGPLALFAQVGWGGIYSDPAQSSARVNNLFDRIAAVISAIDAANSRGLHGSSGRLVVIESELRQVLEFGWLEGLLDGHDVQRWWSDHAMNDRVDRSEDVESVLPTLVAVTWLATAPDG